MLYQLESNGVTVENLRQIVATFLKQLADTYIPFVVSPVASDSPDAAAPNAIDDYISSITLALC